VDEVHPEARLALAVVRAGEEAVDESVVGIGGGVGEEGGDFIGGGGQSDQVEGEAPDEGVAVGFGGGVERLLGELFEDEAIDGGTGPVGEIGSGDWLGDGGFGQGFQGPPIGGFRGGLACWCGGGARGVARVGGAGGDPAGSLPAGGIGSTPSRPASAERRVLAAGSPGTTAGPEWPPARMPSRVSSRRPPLGFLVVAEWHWRQCSTRMGRILDSKNAVD
jgi:hypothetical protein